MLPSWMRSRNCRPRFGVLLRDGHDEAQVGLDQLLLRLLGLPFAADDGVERLLQLARLLLQRVGHRLELELLVLGLLQEVFPVLLAQLLLLVLRMEQPIDRFDLALHTLDAFDRVLHLVDEAPLHGFSELDPADRVRDIDSRAHRGPLRLAILPLVARRRALGRVAELFVELLGRSARLAHGVDLLLHLARPLLDPFVRNLFVVEDHELADRAFARVKLVAQADHLLGDQGRARNRLDDGQLAALDSPSDLDLALAGEKGYRPHLAQIHAHRVVGLVERARREVELELLGALRCAVDGLLVAQVLLVRIDDLDARAAKRVEEIVELFGGGDFRRQQLVHLVVQEIAFLLADVDELPDFVVFLFNRHAQASYVRSSIRCARWRF